MKQVIKTIPVEEGKLYALAGENRYLLADCGASIEIIEDSAELPRAGKRAGDNEPERGIADYL